MNKTNISWCTHTLNPVVGCRRGCKWGEGGCYAESLHNMRVKAKAAGKHIQGECYDHPFEEVRFYPDRLKSITNRGAPKTVFMNSMSDPEYWEPEWTRQILDKCRSAPLHTFMLLTKGIGKLFMKSEWMSLPPNVMLGVTQTNQHEGRGYLDGVRMLAIMTSRGFISMEPLLGPVEFNIPDRIELLIVGAMTGYGAIPPKPEWIQSVRDHRKPGTKIHWKPNIQSYL